MAPDDERRDPFGRVTVGLPVYNDPDGLRTSVPTVLEQSWPGDIRLLIVDDGSDDATPDVIDELRDTYGRIEVVRNRVNQGRPRARNQIVEAAGDDLLAWIDADDLWLPRKLEFQVAALREADPDAGSLLLCTAPFRWVYRDRDQERVKVPDVEGDQLRNALTGSLQPYLWATLGRAAVYREVGGFDERLPRRQDFEFFVRFLRAGGRVVLTDAERPLCTYMKTDLGRDPEEVAAANEVIRRKHEDVYRRYGRRFELEGRRKLHVLVARFQEHNGRRLRSRLTLARAHALDPLLWVDGADDLLPAAKRSYWAARRGYFRVRRIVLRGSRRGRRQLTKVGGAGRRRLRGLLGRFRGGAARDLRRCWPSARDLRRELPTADAVQRTTALLAGAASEVEAQVWLRFERAYRAEGRLWSAEYVLDHATARRPDDPDLRTRLIELLALRRDWHGCVVEWEAWAPYLGEAVRAITYTRVARAYRQLDAPHEALRIAERGLDAFPDDDRLLDELRVARAAVTPWLEVAEPAGGDGPVGGRVRDPGFLGGERAPLRGEIDVDGDREPRVSLLLNGQPIATTTALVSVDDPISAVFSLNCADVLHHLGDGDELRLVQDGRSVAFSDDQVALSFRPGFPSRAHELIDRVAQGHTFNKFGQLRSGNTTGRKRAILDLFDEVSEHLRERYGTPCFPFYGNLLGAIREHDFLPHDVGGFDAGILAASREPEEVRAEILDVCRHLVGLGYHLTVEPWSVMIRRKHGAAHFIDLNYAWVGDDGALRLSYGWRYDPLTDVERFLVPRWSVLADRKVRVPGNAEQVLEQIYGRGWLVPDQGFQLEVGLQRDERYLLTASELEDLREVDPDLVRIRTQIEPEDEA